MTNYNFFKTLSSYFVYASAFSFALSTYMAVNPQQLGNLALPIAALHFPDATSFPQVIGRIGQD